MFIESSKNPQAFNEYEREGWESISSEYELHFTPLTSQTVETILDLANVNANASLLDVCTGPGMLAEGAARRGADVIGIDFSKKMLAIAQRNVSNAEFQLGDAQSLAFGDDCFDAVVCGYGIIHLAEPQAALQEMHRVLKKRGRIALSVWDKPKPTNGTGLFFAAIRAHGNSNVPLPEGPDSFQFSHEKKMAAVLKDAGFSEVEVKTVDLSWLVSSKTGLLTAIVEGGVRARGLFLAQTKDAQSAITNAVEMGMEKYFVSEGVYRVPMPAIVGSGAK